MSISTSGSIAPQHTGELVALSNNDTQASSSDSEELASSLCRAALTSSSVALKRVERDHCPSLGSGNPPDKRVKDLTRRTLSGAPKLGPIPSPSMSWREIEELDGFGLDGPGKQAKTDESPLNSGEEKAVCAPTCEDTPMSPQKPT